MNKITIGDDLNGPINGTLFTEDQKDMVESDKWEDKLDVPHLANCDAPGEPPHYCSCQLESIRTILAETRKETIEECINDIDRMWFATRGISLQEVQEIITDKLKSKFNIEVK